MSEKILFTVRQFSERHPAFTAGSLRALIFNAESRKTSRGMIPGNGLNASGALVRLGCRVLLDEARFFNWLQSQQKRVERVA